MLTLYKIQIRLIQYNHAFIIHALSIHNIHIHLLTCSYYSHRHTHTLLHTKAFLRSPCWLRFMLAVVQPPLCLSFRVLGCWQRPTWTLCSQWSPLCEVPFLFCFPIPVVIKPPTVPQRLQIGQRTREQEKINGSRHLKL